jgi:Tfp pilus assembly protein PilF
VAYVSLAILGNGKPTDQDFRRVADWLETALQKNPKMTVLVGYRASLRSLQGQFQGAEQRFREAIAQNPRNATAMNNLAWLLAFQPGKSAEALDLIRRAIDIVGPIPDAIDTRAMVYLAAGRSDLAVQDMEEVVIARPTADRYFRLARAQHAAKNHRAAVEAFQRAKGLGLSEGVLHPLERSVYQQLSAALDRR